MIRIVVPFIMSLIAAGSGLAAEKVRFATHFKTNALFVLPVLAAIENGFWQQQGVEVEWLPFDSGITTTQAVAAGKVDMGTQGVISLVTAASAGVETVTLAKPMSVGFRFWVHPNSPLRQAVDLKGARIGVIRMGDATHIFARAAAKALKLEGEVKFVAMGGGPPLIAALKAGHIEVATVSDLTMAPLKVKGEVREFVNLDDYLPKGVGAQVIFANPEFLKRKPDAVKKVIKGFLQGADFAMRNPDWAIEKMKTGMKIAEGTARAVQPMLHYDLRGRFSSRDMAEVVEFLVEYGLVAKDKLPHLDRVHSGEFVD